MDTLDRLRGIGALQELQVKAYRQMLEQARAIRKMIEQKRFKELAVAIQNHEQIMEQVQESQEKIDSLKEQVQVRLGITEFNLTNLERRLGFRPGARQVLVDLAQTMKGLEEVIKELATAAEANAGQLRLMGAGISSELFGQAGGRPVPRDTKVRNAYRKDPSGSEPGSLDKKL